MKKTEEVKRHYTYMLLCADGSIYSGYTTDLNRRIAVHNSGSGAKYTRSRLPVKLLYSECFATKSEALKHEATLKKLSHAEKLLLYPLADERMDSVKENYYADNLNAQKLYFVYQTEHERVKQYLESEITFVKRNLCGMEHILELGAGYGRIIKELAPACREIVGIDISEDNVMFGKKYLQGISNAKLMVMDAHHLQFEGSLFDVVLCLQNGLSAMKVEPISYITKVMDLLTQGGKAFFSSYSPKFWEYRLAWFCEQADKGLLGEIDMDKTKEGVIVCKDGFRATTHSSEDMDMIGKASGFTYEVIEVDCSSIFLVINRDGSF